MGSPCSSWLPPYHKTCSISRELEIWWEEHTALLAALPHNLNLQVIPILADPTRQEAISADLLKS